MTDLLKSLFDVGALVGIGRNREIRNAYTTGAPPPAGFPWCAESPVASRCSVLTNGPVGLPVVPFYYTHLFVFAREFLSFVSTVVATDRIGAAQLATRPHSIELLEGGSFFQRFYPVCSDLISLLRVIHSVKHRYSESPL